MKVVFETERLRAREFVKTDASFIIALLNDPDWLKYIGDRHVSTEADAIRYLEFGPFKSYADNGFGAYMIESLDTGEAVGMSGLFKRDYLQDVDLGFALLPAFRGLGLAREMAEATLQYGKNTLGINRYGAFTAKDNFDSMKLLKKIGFVEAGTLLLEGEELSLFFYEST